MSDRTRPAPAPALAAIASLLALLLSGSLDGTASDAPIGEAAKPLTVMLVRHAEKSAAQEDPGLTPEGGARAAQLAALLRDAEIQHVHTTNFKRTRATAAPIAELFGLDVQAYDPFQLATFAKALREAGGRHLVVGHSNTTTELVKLLGADPGSKINDAGEYDRLYVVMIGTDGLAVSTLLRYGAPYVPAPK